MDLSQAQANLAALDKLQADLEILIATEESITLKCELDDVILPLVRLRKPMQERIAALEARAEA